MSTSDSEVSLLSEGASWGLGHSVERLVKGSCVPSSLATKMLDSVSLRSSSSTVSSGQDGDIRVTSESLSSSRALTHTEFKFTLKTILPSDPSVAGSPVPSTPERREGLQACYWEGPSQLPERQSSSCAPRRGSAEPRPRGCSGLGEPRPALPSF